jgi:hypothetical protein
MQVTAVVNCARRMRSEIFAPKLYVALLGIVKKSARDYLLGGCAAGLTKAGNTIRTSVKLRNTLHV